MVKVPTGPVRLREKLGGRTLHLDPSAMLGFGGEARIFAHPDDAAKVCKVYHEHQPERVRKLEVMLAAPPSDPMAARGHPSIVWPSELLLEGGGTVAGFVMPRVEYGAPRVFELYNPKTRRRKAPLFHWQYLHRTARNLASCVAAVHARGYVVGDVNESNLLVNDRALVTMVDTDSLQVTDPATGRVFRCRVGKPEFTPPELHGRAFADVDRRVEHDRFGVAVLLFLLLMEGTHPFTGRYTGAGDPPELSERIRRGHFPYARHRRGPFERARLAPPLEILHPGLQALALRAFEEGHADPSRRPAAEEWTAAVAEAERALKVCPRNAQHHYSGHLSRCTWCERAAMLHGRDAFPDRQTVATGRHLAPRPGTPGIQHGLPSAFTPPPPAPAPATKPPPRFRLPSQPSAPIPSVVLTQAAPAPRPATAPAAAPKLRNGWATAVLVLAVLGIPNVGRGGVWGLAVLLAVPALWRAARSRGKGIYRLLAAGVAGWVGLLVPAWSLPEAPPPVPYTETAPAGSRGTPGVAPEPARGVAGGAGDSVAAPVLIDGRPAVTGRAPRPEEEPARRLQQPALPPASAAPPERTADRPAGLPPVAPRITPRDRSDTREARDARETRPSSPGGGSPPAVAGSGAPPRTRAPETDLRVEESLRIARYFQERGQYTAADATLDAARGELRRIRVQSGAATADAFARRIDALDAEIRTACAAETDVATRTGRAPPRCP